MNFLGVEITPDFLATLKAFSGSIQRFNLFADAANAFIAANPQGTIGELQQSIQTTLENLMNVAELTEDSTVEELMPTLSALAEQMATILH